MARERANDEPPFLEENGGVRLGASISVGCAVGSGRLFYFYSISSE
jgi:hypothetical protein